MSRLLLAGLIFGVGCALAAWWRRPRYGSDTIRQRVQAGRE